MLTLILAGLVAAPNSSSASPSPFAQQLAQATPPAAQPAEAPKSRRVCHDVPVSNSRFTRRVCSTVVDRQAEAAQAPPRAPPVMTTLAVGMRVVDAQGGEVGIITALAADSVTVRTDKHQAQLPKTSLTLSEGKALFGLTQADLNASVEQALATIRMAQFKVGAPVTGAAGASIGTIDAVEADSLTIRLASGSRISVPRSGISANADGGGVIGLTAAELEAQVNAAKPSG